MKIETWMTREVLACRPETRLDEAARLMWENDCGCLPVVDAEDRVVGIVTDRDVLMGAYTQGRALADLAVSTCMTHGAMAALPSDDVVEVIRMMGDRQVRRIPVVDEQRKLVGLVSLNDLARRTTEIEEPAVSKSLRTRLFEALACVCAPRGCPCELPAVRPEESATPPKKEARKPGRAPAKAATA
jgi:CBS domain-containing protein